jgi:UDP-N-acetylglucosamine 2-epimerase (non-hydrolysing)
MKIILVAGARPNFMKIAPIIRAIKSFNQTNQRNQRNHRNQINQRNLIDYKLVHTGQHYDYEMSKVFFEDLELPEPDIYLGVGSGTHAEQTGRVMIEFERVLFKEKPDLVLVVGDVNSTLACALAASKIYYSKELGANIKVDAVKGEQILVNNPTNSKNSINAMNARGYRPLIAHVEAGLRSFDRTMPEEINRLLTDQISDFLFTPSPDANENLKKEGIPEEKIFLVGNVMVDSLLYNLQKAKKSEILERLGLTRNLQSAISKAYCLLSSNPSPSQQRRQQGSLFKDNQCAGRDIQANPYHLPNSSPHP